MNKETKKALRKNDLIRCYIRKQGAPVVNGGYVYRIGRNIVALEIDLKSKYCEVSISFKDSDGTCGLYITTNERSIHLNKKVSREEPTVLEFPDFIGWDVFAYGIGRYTLSVCLVK